MIELLDPTLSVLLWTTATVAVAHALLGIDHSLPFIVIGRTRHWSMRRTMVVTIGCGIGHVASSVVIGGVGALLGSALTQLVDFEAARGELAAVLLMGFGLSYATWSFWRLRRSATHSHLHAHADGTVHDHPHDHRGEHLHPHFDTAESVTPWALFVIFLLGPCEPLIPLMVVPAMDHSWIAVGAVVVIFGAITIATMAATVAFGFYGLRMIAMNRLTRFADVGAGLVVAASGAAVFLVGI